ncbi:MULTISPECIES: ABC transporter substrate-binding protein [unclassified Clostridium]|uniref:ABC transporter substrate-binding protein n=1 Tax=unclassified Clostridium TaxID=2614128 RepID=UPI000297D6CE|nr:MULTISPECIES: ABC transporter substrate-binding protein [unclassified Clostridium]EKQ52370.1 MAG: ABC-type Fe3+-hydroxamate transport system, periplasmic component [Clostridium sp. Maddingley MBC34-26]
MLVKKAQKLIIFSLLVVMFSSTLSGCSKQADSSSKESELKTRTVIDIEGRKVELPKEVKKVALSLNSITQMVYMLGAGNKIVATQTNIKSIPLLVKIYPNAINIPAPFDTKLNSEALINTNPDVVIMDGESNDALRDQIASLNIPVVTISFQSAEKMRDSIKIVGQTLGSEEEKKADEFSNYYNNNIKIIKDKTNTLSEKDKVKVYYCANNELNTEGKNTIVDSWIQEAGGVNVAAQAGVEGKFKDVTLESILKWNPDVIIVRDAKTKDSILSNQDWNNIDAVKNGKIYVNPKSMYLWCVRSAEAALQPLWAAKILHPDLFSNINIDKEVKDFYIKNYNYTLSDEDLKNIYTQQQ